jgi:hypothetical protein
VAEQTLIRFQSRSVILQFCDSKEQRIQMRRIRTAFASAPQPHQPASDMRCSSDAPENENAMKVGDFQWM